MSVFRHDLSKTGRSAQPQLAHAGVQRGAGDLQKRCRPVDVPLCLLQGLSDQAALIVGHGIPQRHIGHAARIRSAGAGGGRAGCSAKNLYGVQLDETVKL